MTVYAKTVQHPVNSAHVQKAAAEAKLRKAEAAIIIAPRFSKSARERARELGVELKEAKPCA